MSRPPSVSNEWSSRPSYTTTWDVTVLTGQWSIATIVAYEIAFLWIIHIRDSIAEQRWFDDGMTGERPKQRVDVRSSLFVLVLHVAMLAHFTWMGFRYDEW